MKFFSRFLIFSGIFNIVMAAPLIVPGFTQTYFNFLWNINQGLSLGGVRPVAPQQGVNALLVNTAGIDLVLIGIIVVYSGFDPARRSFIPFVNAVARSLFAFIIIYYAIAFNIARIVVAIGAIDLLISTVFFYCLIKLKRS